MDICRSIKQNALIIIAHSWPIGYSWPASYIYIYRYYYDLDVKMCVNCIQAAVNFNISVTHLQLEAFTDYWSTPYHVEQLYTVHYTVL